MPEIGFATQTAVDERVDERTVPTDEGDHERFSHYVDKHKLTEAMVMGTPVVALCGKVWVPSRAPEKFPVCPDCKEIWESMKPGGEGGGQGTGPSDRTATSRSSRPSDSRTHSGLAGARGVGHGAAPARLADRCAHRLRRARPA